jgi:glycosyltransferase involved in cell wall biosynthesis
VTAASPKLSAVLAVRDEERMIEGALRLLGFCDEIVVVIDDRTSDRTEEIARRYTDEVHLVPFENFAQIKNEGVRRARGEWIVFCDADERVTPRLARNLQDAVAAGTEMCAYYSPTVNFFYGRRMRFGGWSEAHVKIVRRDQALHAGDVHETLDLPRERVGWLEGERWHFSHRSITESLGKTLNYGAIESAQRYESGAAPVTAWRLLRVMLRDIARRMLRRAGWRDGMPGVIEGVYQPFSLFCVEVMLWERQNAHALDQRYEEFERAAAEEH